MIWNTFQDEYYGEKIDITSEQILEKVDKMIADISKIREKMLRQRKKFIASASEAFSQLEDILYI